MTGKENTGAISREEADAWNFGYYDARSGQGHHNDYATNALADSYEAGFDQGTAEGPVDDE